MTDLTRRVGTVHTHEQTTPSSSWNIAHNLKAYPIVDVFVNVDGALNKIIPLEVIYIDKDNCTVTFTTQYAGYATVA